MLPQAQLDLGVRDRLRDLQTIALIDLLGARLDLRLGRLVFLLEELLEVGAQLVEQSDVLGKLLEHAVHDRFDLPIQRVLVPHRRRPADAGVGECVDQQARRMRLLGEKRAVEHRRAQHRHLQPADQGLDAVGQILGLEDEVEQHRHQLDRHRLELIRLRAERRLLQVAQHVVHVLLEPCELERNAAVVHAAFAVLQAGQRVAQFRRRQDARSAERADCRLRLLRSAAAGHHAERVDQRLHR